uniref:Uncharacterized protein n=1 Tax=Sus scrofa TaxID=9823 RepID=A0A4X1SS13_PIG
MTFHLPWACVIIGCIFVSLGRASNTPDVYPPLWKESPGQFSDYKVEDGKYIINIWHYLERLGTYKILLNKTAKYFEKFAPENEQNIFMGIASLDPFSLARLADPTQRTNCGHESGDYLCISVDSWWADVNYYLSAMPFLAAVDSGIMGISSDNITFLFLDFEDLLKYLWAAHIYFLNLTSYTIFPYFHLTLPYSLESFSICLFTNMSTMGKYYDNEKTDKKKFYWIMFKSILYIERLLD